VQEYEGQGYEVKSGSETDETAEAHREEVEKAVTVFFLNEYKTEVKVIFGNEYGATVYVESTGLLHFYHYRWL
jgi:hypothetical protein